VARREHHAIIEHIEKMQHLEPGLYEMMIEGETGERDPRKEQFRVRFEKREIKDITCLIPKSAFDKMDRLSVVNENLYLAFGRPLVKTLIRHPQQAAALRWLYPARVSRYIWSDQVNPWMKIFESWAAWIKDNRSKADEANTFSYIERRHSENIATFLDACRDIRDTGIEVIFEAIYRE